MTIEKETLAHDVLYFVKDDLINNINDPFSSTRSNKSKFVMTSYPKRPVQYPIITIKLINVAAKRAGMQTTAQDITLVLEIRIWARDEKEKDKIFDEVFNRLANIQYTAVTGSTANNLHDLTIGSAVEVDEETVKSRIIQLTYKFYNI